MTYLKLSPTKAATWVDCPRRFFYTYIERRRSDQTWAHFSFGQSVHNALREWFELPPEHRSAATVPALVSKAWIEAGFKDREQAALWRDKAIEMIASYVQTLDPQLQPFSTERTLAFKHERFIMEGRIDRIDAQGDNYSVVDYKTGKSLPSSHEVRGSQALAMYAAMVQRALGKQCLDVSLHHLPSGEVVSWRHTADSLQRHLDRISQIAGDITVAQDTWEGAHSHDDDVLDQVFPARPSALCGFCDHWEVCAVGQAFTSRRQSWEGLAVHEA